MQRPWNIENEGRCKWEGRRKSISGCFVLVDEWGREWDSEMGWGVGLYAGLCWVGIGAKVSALCSEASVRGESYQPEFRGNLLRDSSSATNTSPGRWGTTKERELLARCRCEGRGKGEASARQIGLRRSHALTLALPCRETESSHVNGSS